MNEMEYTKDQISAIDHIIDWYKTSKQILRMSGFAGTGKTTVAVRVREILAHTTTVAYCAYTGKAASVLRSKLQGSGLVEQAGDYCGTIHSMIYKPIICDDDGESVVTGWELVERLNYNLIICDESSMINEDIYDDMRSFGVPILFIGDGGQLPPISGSLNLMKNPDIQLEELHRFAEQDALIKVSMLAREEGVIPYGTYGDLVHKVPMNHSMVSEFIKESGNFKNSAVLCGFNKTRVNLNKTIRKELGYTTVMPQVGERVICLKNNKNAEFCPVYNGVQGTVKMCTQKTNSYKLSTTIDGEKSYYRGTVFQDMFNNESPNPSNAFVLSPNKSFNKATKTWEYRKIYLDCFDFGYGLTVHKSQGSEWERVMVIEQPCKYWEGPDWNKWLYTAVTRSRGRLLITRK